MSASRPYQRSHRLFIANVDIPSVGTIHDLNYDLVADADILFVVGVIQDMDHDLSIDTAILLFIAALTTILFAVRAFQDIDAAFLTTETDSDGETLDIVLYTNLYVVSVILSCCISSD